MTRGNRAGSLRSRIDGTVRDVAAFRAVAYADLVTQQFDGHPYTAAQGVALAERNGGCVPSLVEKRRGGRLLPTS